MFGRGHHRTRRILGSAVGALGGALVMASGAQAATFTVTTTADTDGTCTPASCSAREAVKAADAADGNVVVIPAGIFKLNTSDSPFGELRITKSMTVTGAGARSTIVDANGRSRAFFIDTGTTVTFQGLTVTGGEAPAVNPPMGYTTTFPRDGGGIFTRGTLTLREVTLRNNHAAAGGGGLATEGPFFEGPNVTIQGVTIDRSTLSGNTVSGGTENGQGGGLFVFGNLTMTNSTVAGNSVTSPGTNEGGGVLASSGDVADGGIVTMTNVTIAGNSVSGGTPATNFGGGFSGDAINSFFSLPSVFYSDLRATNTVIAGNTDTGAPEDCALVHTTTSDHDISGDGSCGFSGPGSKQGTDPGLLPLESRGGPTDTMGLSPTSAATNTGTNSGCPTIDQRGVTRPQAVTCDVGALELALPTAETGDPTNLRLNSATINGKAGNPHVDPGTVFFQYGTTLDYGTTTPAQPLAAGARKRRRKRSKRGRIKARAAAASFRAELTGLRSGAVYHYRIGSTNRDGTAFGKDRSFRVLNLPKVSVLGVPRSCVRGSFSVRVRTRVSRATKLRSVRVRLDGKLIKRSKSSNVTVRIDGSKLSSGRHKVEVRATDRGGRSRLIRHSFSRCAQPKRLSPQFTG